MGCKLAKKNILIADDAPENIKVLAETLKSDYNISVAINGPEALEIAALNLPDLILLDIVMPGMDGYEVCRRLKADTQTRNIPVIFITVRSEKKKETRGFELGAVDYITKPFSPAVVKVRVRTHLELKQHQNYLEELVAELFDSIDAYIPVTSVPASAKIETDADLSPTSFIGDKKKHIFDQAVFMSRINNSMKLAKTLIGMFFNGYPACLSNIKTAIADRDNKALGDAAHYFKGMLLNLSADPVSETALKLEITGQAMNLSRAEVISQTEETFADLEVKTGQLVQVLNEFVSNEQ
ncbi:MAG: hypothetical protein DRI57_15815 [Deltaproteobacteria bacterium]|nr:MAG: hypothetical protein DRI57_15815 [Deltaproteobacteria bacterium]